MRRKNTVFCKFVNCCIDSILTRFRAFFNNYGEICGLGRHTRPSRRVSGLEVIVEYVERNDQYGAFLTGAIRCRDPVPGVLNWADNDALCGFTCAPVVGVCNGGGQGDHTQPL